MATIMQGDQYKIPFSLTDVRGNILTDEYIQDIEICIGTLKYKKPDITYNSNFKVWEFPLTEEDSFKIMDKYVRVQIRIWTFDNNIIGIPLGEIKIMDSMSKERFIND